MMIITYYLKSKHKSYSDDNRDHTIIGFYIIAILVGVKLKLGISGQIVITYVCLTFIPKLVILIRVPKKKNNEKLQYKENVVR